jgi:uncharacterized membrane protein (DUF106 family)
MSIIPMLPDIASTLIIVLLAVLILFILQIAKYFSVLIEEIREIKEFFLTRSEINKENPKK